MQITTNVKKLSLSEETNIEEEIKADLLDHWFRAIPPGAIVAIIGATIFFIFFYSRASLFWLTIWYGGLCFINLAFIGLYVFYKKDKNKFTKQLWHMMLSILAVITAGFLGATIFFGQDELIPQFIVLVSLFITAACYSIITVGMFYVSLLSTFCILAPIAYWFFSRQEFYFIIGGFFVLAYFAFMSGMNYRSTRWLIESLRLSKMLASFTHQANFDLLTDLPNQRLLTQYLEEVIAKIKNTHENFALVCVSINRLDIFNNSLGYQAGDLVIHSVAKRFEKEINDMNFKDKGTTRILTKPRPDSFCILIVPANQKVDEEIRKLLTCLEQPFHLGRRESRLTASVGVTIFPRDSDNASKLLSNTFAAMLEAKLKGGNQVEYYKTTMTSDAPLMLELENDLNKALEKHELEVYYQPIVELKSKTITGAEALMRWNHSTRGMISPGNFIPLAEATGLIIPMSEWILEQALIQTKLWHQLGFSDFRIAINLSPKQLKEGNLFNTITNILDKTHFNPNFLELELTETAMLDESVASLIKQISEQGISLSIDDFGTGYSGLSYLKHFHIDKIKIDRSFIQDVINNTDSAAIVTATLAMAKELNIKTLAEGVETKEQLAFLIERQCQYIQGFYFSKPINAGAFETLLKQGISDKF